MPARISEALVLGLSMGPACLGYCAPVFVPIVASRKQTGWTGATRTIGLFLLGRLAGYTAIGGIVGLAGVLLLQNLTPAIWGSVRLVMGLLLILSGLLSDPPGIKWCMRIGRNMNPAWIPLFLGLLTGLNLCPPFAAAITGAAERASLEGALVYFWVFFAGTAVYFLPLAAMGPLTRFEPFRQVARVCVFLAGAWLIIESFLQLLSP